VVTTRRVFAVLLVLVAVALAYTAWLVLQVRGDLTDAERAADRLRSSLHAEDDTARNQAISDFQTSAADAADHTDGAWWSLLTHAPLVGDDAAGVRALSSSLDTIGSEGVAPLTETVVLLEQISGGGRIDLAVLDELAAPVDQARAAFAEASAEVDDVDTSGFTRGIRTRFDEYVDVVAEADRLLASGVKATEVLPTMVGSGGPRDYLLVFQDNAQIRATGGVPWFWGRIHAVDGRLTMEERGTLRAFEERASPLPLSKAEATVYGEAFGTRFGDAGFTPDFPRAAELLAAHWEEQQPGPTLDGVIALDPVAVSYLLKGTGPLRVGNLELRSDNVIEALLSQSYKTLDSTRQEALFNAAGRAIFAASTRELPDPVSFFSGMERAAAEGRMLVAPFGETEQERLVGTKARGALARDDGATPHVDIGINDAGGTKLSYYLRYESELRASGCEAGRQVVVGTLTLSQAISAGQATNLPIAVRGEGPLLTEPGRSLLRVRLYGPYGGNVSDLRVNLERADGLAPVRLDGRPVVTVPVAIDPEEEVEVSWTMTTGRGQTDDIALGLTPSVVPGPSHFVTRSAC
jgi:hypothetical protein